MALRLLCFLTLMASGRAMTLAFIHRAGQGGPGDPPAAWLMPLVGDAVIGIAALAVLWALIERPGPKTWLAAVVWNALAAWDAVSAGLVHATAPWPDFFMIEVFGPSMFVAATAMHLVCLGLLARRDVRNGMGVRG